MKVIVLIQLVAFTCLTACLSQASYANTDSCSIEHAVYKPSNEKQIGKKGADFNFNYELTIKSNPHYNHNTDMAQYYFYLTMLDRKTGEHLSSLRMDYDVGGNGIIVGRLIFPARNGKENMMSFADLAFLDKSFASSISFYDAKAPYAIVIPDMWRKFYYEGRSIDQNYMTYYSDRKVMPGAPTGDDADFIPNVWVLKECL